MTTTSNAFSVDGTADMAIDDPYAHSNNHDKSKETSPTEFHTFKLKFEICTKNDDVSVVNIHRELLFEIANNHDGTIFYNNIKDNNNCFDPFVSDDELMKTSYKYLKLKRSNYDVHCFAHSIASYATFNEINETCEHILR